MKVEYYHERPGGYTGNILWPIQKSRNGRFSPTHPVAPNAVIWGNSTKSGEMGPSDKMSAFRALGYWASCFPEGDGITMRCERGQNTAKVVEDIKAVFGWDVVVKRGDTDQ